MPVLNQLPSDVDLAFVAGDTFRMRVRVVNPTTGLPVLLDGHTFCSEIAKLPERSIVAQFTVTPDPDAPAEAVIMTLSKTETAALPGLGDGTVFKGIWDLEVTFPDGDIRTVAKGDITCEIDVSNCAV
jgi:hypothetical protein